MRYYDILGADVKKFGFSEMPIPARIVSQKECAKTKDVITIVKGGTLDVNRKIVRSNCDVLLDPVGQKMEVDTAILRIAKERGITMGISLSQFFGTRGMRRIRMLHNYMNFIRLCNKIGSRVVLTTNASDISEQRQPIHLISFGVMLGMTKQQAKWSISMVPEYLVRRKMK
ncbi:MAG: hypothetical protein J7K68_01110 [Candidatus Diapherotrites archaeon]|nr:hypothetical protein [Candidatus Diapherotrites archaeon]